MKYVYLLLVYFLSFLLLSGCSGDDADDQEVEGGVLPADRTFIVFNPAFSQLPSPNDLLFAGEPAADGTMFAGNDPANPVIGGIDDLDGNSLLSPLEVSFTASLDANQTFDAASFVQVGEAVIPNPQQNVFLLPLTFPSGDGLLQASADIDNDGSAESLETPTFWEALQYQRAVAANDLATLSGLANPKVRAELVSLNGGSNNTLRIVPLEPLLPKTKYLVVVTRLNDANGNPVFLNPAYESIRDPGSNLAGVNPALVPLRPAVQGWEQLAQGYFGFMQSVFDSANVAGSAPAYDDILMTLTFTTAGVEDVLTSLAAPETFFDASLRSGYKKDAIVKLVTGVYTLDGAGNGLTSATDLAINQTLNFLLTSALLPGEQPNPLYNPVIAGAIAAGADYAALANDASAAFIMQSAAAQAAIQVHDSGDEAQGDAAPFIDIASEAAGTVLALSANDVQALFPVPRARDTRFFRVDPAAAINSALPAPALVYQGEIELAQYQAAPGESGAELLTEAWTADPNIGAALDVARGQPQGTTPPSDKTTYRYPFPAEKATSRVPLLAVMPDATTLASFGVTKPEAGWPVVIALHGITTDRSTVLPTANAMAFACVAPDLSGPSGAPCFATVAIDQPLHGVSVGGSVVPGLFNASAPGADISANLPVGDPLAPSESLSERHFNFTADASAQPIPMDYDNNIGSSGSLFINLTNFANTRDRLRQAVLDLMNLNASLATMDIDGDGIANDIDTSRVYFIGTSLGGVDGIPFVAVNNSAAVQNSMFNNLPRVNSAAFLNTGGGLPRLLSNSPALGPRILGGLAAASDQLVAGASGLESYLNVFQGVLASVDPMNFAAFLSPSAADTGILLTEIIGDGSAAQPSDQTIPNAADTRWGAANGPLVANIDGLVINNLNAPLAGTEPLIAQFGAIKSADAVADGNEAVLVTRFIEGSHGTPVSAGNTDADPLSSAAVFAETVSQIVTLFAGDGLVAGSLVTNAEVVED